MPPITAVEIKSIEDAKSAFLAAHKELMTFAEKASEEIKTANSVSTETKSALEAFAEKANKAFDRLAILEAKVSYGGGRQAVEKSAGAQFVESDICKSLMSGQTKQARMSVKTIINATGQNQPLVPSQRLPGIIAEPNRILRIRDLLRVGRTNSNLIEYTKENVFTNNAAPQYGASPVETEGQKKPESMITFTLANTPVITIAHFIKASKQVLSDSPQLQSYIDGRLTYGLKLEEEDEILNGDGTASQLNGLLNQATAYNRGATADTAIDTIRKAITQGQLSNYMMTGIILNPAQWEEIELTKDSQNRYIFASPQSLAGPTLWGLPVVASNTMPNGQFLVGAYDMAAELWDREEASVQVGFENDDFTRNLVTILAEERLALTVYREAALIKGAL